MAHRFKLSGEKLKIYMEFLTQVVQQAVDRPALESELIQAAGVAKRRIITGIDATPRRGEKGSGFFDWEERMSETARRLLSFLQVCKGPQVISLLVIDYFYYFILFFFSLSFFYAFLFLPLLILYFLH